MEEDIETISLDSASWSQVAHKDVMVSETRKKGPNGLSCPGATVLAWELGQAGGQPANQASTQAARPYLPAPALKWEVENILTPHKNTLGMWLVPCKLCEGHGGEAEGWDLQIGVWIRKSLSMSWTGFPRMCLWTANQLHVFAGKYLVFKKLNLT